MNIQQVMLALEAGESFAYRLGVADLFDLSDLYS